MKYIDADKLKAHIQYLIKKDNYELFDVPELLSFIASLQDEQNCIVINKKDWEAQEQFRKSKAFGKPLKEEKPEVDLEEEYKEYVEDDLVFSILVNRNVGLAIARHFYELGFNARKV